MSGDEVTSLNFIYIVPHSRAWHLASHSLTFCRFVLWLSGAELVTSHRAVQAKSLRINGSRTDSEASRLQPNTP